MNQLAIAATPKLCGRNGGILSLVPYSDNKNGIRTKFEYLCLDHAAEVATWRWLHSHTSVVQEEQDV